MDEYIEREALKNAIATSTEPFTARLVFRTINNQPAADVAPVRRGRWLEAGCFDIGFWRCSCCGFLSEEIAAPKLYRYCPNCGENMEVQNG